MNYIITSSILILLVILVRAVLKGKIMLRIQYAMWLLVLVRLLIPVQLGSSPLSIMNVASIIETSANVQTNDDLFTNTNSNVNKNDNAVTNTNVDTNKSEEAVLNNAESAVAGSQMSDGSTNQAIVENNIINSSENTNTAIKQDVGGKSLNIGISTVVLCCWIVGAVILGGILLVSNIIFRYRLIHTRKRLEISDYPLAVYISNEVPSSCLFGIFKPAVYLTEEAAVSDEQRRFVLEHELTHFRHMDHVWSILRNIILVIHWYNPLIWVAAVLSRRDAELACDEATISRIGDSARVEYGKALLELSQIKRRKVYLLSFSVASNNDDLKERINMLVYKPSMKKITAVVLALVLCVITACTFTGKNDKDQTDTEGQQISNEQPKTEGESDFETQEQQETEADDKENEYPRGERIAEQSFEVTLEPLGEVTFSSYLPDDTDNPLADAVFLIEQEGQILMQLPGVTEDNVNHEKFNQVEAVNFSDYNYDGCDDIILIISYYLGDGSTADMSHSTIRYYTGSNSGEFIYEKQMSEDATYALDEITIKSAKEFIGYEGEQKNDLDNDVTQTEQSDRYLLYEAFLNNEISVSNPYVEGMQLTVMDDEKYTYEDAQKSYAYVDVNGDEKEELIFKISSYPSEMMYILGIYNNELICFDVFETHSIHMGFGVYDNGMVWDGQNYDGDETIFYTYTADGQPVEAGRFTEEDEADITAFIGNEPEWVAWTK